MINFQGRSSVKQYMPLKPTKQGIKMWVLGDSQTGYFTKFDVYCGKGYSPEKNLGTRVVKTLTLQRHSEEVPSHLLQQLREELLEKDGVYACGTARKDCR